MTDPVLWGVVSIVVSVTVIAVGVLYASMATADPLDPLEPPVPVDAEEGFTYTCHCYRDPVRVTIR
ncbi:hypothetical protein [Streptomyces sp. SID4917]|uniref:hypothetical protein n=1 Tax=Streptomyces sp. SID4917 TaxID=2690269 RepID=UPI00137209A1|nr:hypothetical protein [Streptomyces sp. SID4917]MYZ35948.1 hypothetical protein [Streptomyces sp. SID4917]